MTQRPDIQVAAIIPFSEDSGDDVLVLNQTGTVALPCAELLSGEHFLEAASRISHETTGLRVVPQRILYLLEPAVGGVVVGVLCAPVDDSDGDADLRGEVASLSRIERDFWPMALLEILVEDLRSGFIRPVAHIVESSGAEGRNVQITW